LESLEKFRKKTELLRLLGDLLKMGKNDEKTEKPDNTFSRPGFRGSKFGPKLAKKGSLSYG
jgi:hypothetical protein